MGTLGRRQEQDAIERLTAEDQEGALLLVGERGSGKTHLLHQAMERSPIRTRLLRSSPAESRWSLSGLQSFLALATGGSTVDAPEIEPEWLSDDRRAVNAASDVLEYLRGLRLPSTLVLIDDIHELDPDSRLLMSVILGRLHDTGLRVVATLAAERAAPLLEHLPRIEIRPLDRDEIISLALMSARHALAEAPAVILAGYADGNPGVMLELADGLDPMERSGAVPLRLPPRAGPRGSRLGEERMADLDVEARLLLETIASAPITRRGSITRGEPRLEDALHDLLTSGLIEQRGHAVRVRDGAVRLHLERAASAQSRRERYGTALNDDAVDVRMRPWHRSFLLPDPAIALRLLEVAAALVREGAVAAGVECAERARIIAEGEPFGADGFIELASALVDAGELVLAGRYVDVGRQPAMTPRAQVQLAVLRQQVAFLHHQRVLDLDVRMPGWIVAEPERSVELLSLTAIAHALRFELPLAEEMLGRIEQIEGRLREPYERRAAMIVRAVAGEEVEEFAAPLTAHTDVLDVLLAARIAFIRGRFSRARELCRLVLDRRPLQPIWFRVAQHTLIEVEICDGRFGNAHRLAAALGRVPSSVSRRPRPTMLDAWIAVAEDRVDTAVSTIAALLDAALQGDNPAHAASLLVLHGKLALLAGDHEQAMLSLAKADAIDRELENPGLVRHLPDFVAAAVRAGRRAEVEDSVRRFERRVDRMPSRWGRLAVQRIQATLAEPEPSITAFEGIIAGWHAEDSPLDHGGVYVLQAERLEVCGRRTDAKRALVSACDAFAEAGAPAWARNARRRLETLNGAGEASPFPGVELTAEEMFIVEAIQQGMRTKELAAALHLSVRAVELRLTNIYRAAGVHSRTELVQRLRSTT